MASTMSVLSLPVSVPVPAELLIEAVKNHAVLYDKAHPRYKDNDFKDELWKQIGTELGSSGTRCQTKFKNLKDTYNKIRNQVKKSMKSGAGTADIPTVKWKHFKAMMEIMEPVYEEPMLCTNIDFTCRETQGTQHSAASIVVLPPHEPDQAEFSVLPVDHEVPPGTSSSSAEPHGPATQESSTIEMFNINFYRSLESAEQDASSDNERQERPSTLFCLQRIAAVCLEQLKAVREQKLQTQDTVYHCCMTLAGQLRELSPECRFEAMHDIQNLIYPKLRQAMEQRK
ncbi:unnamed protein product [Ixodes hexagonus]